MSWSKICPILFTGLKYVTFIYWSKICQSKRCRGTLFRMLTIFKNLLTLMVAKKYQNFGYAPDLRQIYFNLDAFNNDRDRVHDSIIDWI